MFAAMDFWFDLGVDGLRLDAVPYLFEREGTNCENLPETHEALRDLRKHVDEKYRDRMLLAEANQWPEDAVAYFGAGDECHMAFHFPVMPRLFMGLRMEDRYPITDILKLTPAIPDTCQWAMFLRNHDELTLEMVTDEERDYMYRTYARDREMRINLGIRRRLAPLLENDRPRIELMNALLFSLPGTPVLYYGDEIGMGDNIFLGDRNGVRTPMQWSSDRNAGFSRANPQRLYLPVNIDPEYHYETINVEAQQNNSHSLLWFTKRLIQQRKQLRGIRPRHAGISLSQQSQGAGLHPAVRRRDAAGRRQPVALRAVRGTGSGQPPGHGAGGGLRPRQVPHHHRNTVPAVARAARLLLVPSAAAERRRRSHSTSAAHRRSCRCSRSSLSESVFSEETLQKLQHARSAECCAPVRGSWGSNATSPGFLCKRCWTLPETSAHLLLSECRVRRRRSGGLPGAHLRCHR